MKKRYIFHHSEIFYIILISLFYVLLIAFYTRGKLLFGGDQAGYYNYYDFIQSPTFSSLMWGFSQFVSIGNIYVAFYFRLFLGTLFSTLGMYILTRLIFNETGRRDGILMGLLSSLFFLFNTWSANVTYLSLIGDVSFSVGGLTFFFVGIFLFLNDNTSKRLRKFSSVISGLGLGIAQGPFPGYVRLLVVVVVIFLCMGLVFFMRKINRNSDSLRKLVIFAFITVSVSILFSVEHFIPIVSNLHATLNLAKTGASDKVYLGFYTGEFNNIINVLRGINGWQFPGIFYYSLYEKINILSAISFLWPIFALLLPLVFIMKSHKNYATRVIILESALLLVIFWDKGENPPFGGIWLYINSFLPTGYQFIPTGYLSSIFMSRFFPILAAFSIVTLYDYMFRINKTSRIQNYNPRKINLHIKKTLSILIPVILAIFLISSAYPVFVGYAETYSYTGSNQNHRGFFIPQSYFQARKFLVNNNNGSVLLLPPSTSNPYITTNWGYSGEIGFYSNFFAPVSLITMNNFGGTYSNTTQQSEYEALTQPSINLTSPNSTNLLKNYILLLTNRNIRYLMVDSSITEGNAISVNESMSLINALVTFKMAIIVYTSEPITIVLVNTGCTKTNEIFPDNFVADSGLQIYSYNLNASLYQDAGFADAGNIVTFSVQGYNGTSPPEWYENGTYLGESDNFNITFSQAGTYGIEAKLPNGTALHMNYTVNRKMTAVIAIPDVVIAGTTVYVTGAVFGGTTFPQTSYNWEWYINGVYQKNVGDANYDISMDFRTVGEFNLTLIVHDGLGEVASVSVEVHALNPTVYKIENGLRKNVTPGSIFYFILIILTGIDLSEYVRANRRTGK